MFKKFYIFTLFLFFLASCGNENTDYPGGSSGSSTGNAPPVAYKIFTLVFYKQPYTSEMLYHFIQLANFNKIESSYFIFMDVDDPNFKSKMDIFLSKRTENINLLSLSVVPKDIPEPEKFQNYVERAVFLFPSEKPKFEASNGLQNTSSSASTTKAKNDVHIFPENYNYLSSTLKIRYSLQDKTFLASVLKYLAAGNINKPNISNIDEIAYIQGETYPLAGIRVLQGENSKSFKEKSNIKALDDGVITGIPINPKENTQIQLVVGKKQSTYWLDSLSSSFLFFNLKPMEDNQISIASYFAPLKIENLMIAGKKITLDKTNEKKAIYTLNFTIDSKADAKTNSWTGDYKNGILSLTISPDLLPITYKTKDDSWNITPMNFVKSFAEVKETKKDYDSRNSGAGKVTLLVANDEIIDENEILDNEEEPLDTKKGNLNIEENSPLT